MIIDFGLAKIAYRASRMCGTPDYLAPEIFKENYSNLVDIFSLGVIAFEAIFSGNFYNIITEMKLSEINVDDALDIMEYKINTLKQRKSNKMLAEFVLSEKMLDVNSMINEHQNKIIDDKEKEFENYSISKLEIFLMIIEMLQVSFFHKHTEL